MKNPIAAVVQYGLTLAAAGIGIWIIIAGAVIEPPAALFETINRYLAGLQRLIKRPAAA